MSSDSSSSSSSFDSETNRKDNGSLKKLKRKRDADGIEEEVSEEGNDNNASSSSESDLSESETSEEINPELETTASNVLSHAAQRKLKKKAQKTVQGLDISEKEKRQVTKKETDVNPRRQNSIWIGNLAFKTTEQALRDFFARHVPGCEVTRVNMPKKNGQDVKGGDGMRGQNKGFAYVDFSTEEAKLKAIEASEQNLDGRKLLIKDGRNFEGRPSGPPIEGDSAKSKSARKILATQKEPPGPTIFVGNLGFQVTETSLREMLERNRKVREVAKEDNEVVQDQTKEEKSWIRKIRLGTFEDSGKCKGWAFVDFYNVEDATHVLINPKNHFLDGRKLVVEYASQEAVRRGGGGPRTQIPHKKHTKNLKQENSKGSNHEEKEDTADEPILKKMRLETSNISRPKRPKPGAALAMAQRETAAIVPFRGKKIVF